MGDKVCRACLSTKESFRFFLFKSISADDYFFCTSVQAQDTDDLPKALCDPCYKSLNLYLQFKQTCIDSQNTLVSCGKNEPTTDGTLDGSLDKQNDDQDLEKVKVEMGTAPEEINEDAVSSSQEECSEAKDLQVKVRTMRRAKRVGSHKRQHSNRQEPHELGLDGTTILNCYTCNKSFATYSGLSRHNSSAHVRMRLSLARCGVCGRVCASTHALREHARAHQVERVKCVCHLCGKRVSTPVILKAHLETHNVDRERRHTCERCGKKFYTNTILQSHITRLHSGRRYICDLCQYPFTDKHNLAKHIIKHEGKKPFKCDLPYCLKEYATNSALVEHKRTHSGEKPFECTFCPKRFVSKRRLIDHHRIHTGEKPHSCGVCAQRFTQRGTLQRHLKVHNKEVAVT